MYIPTYVNPWDVELLEEPSLSCYCKIQTVKKGKLERLRMLVAFNVYVLSHGTQMARSGLS